MRAQRLLAVGKVKLVTAGPWMGTWWRVRGRNMRWYRDELCPTSIDSNVLCPDVWQSVVSEQLGQDGRRDSLVDHGG